MSDCKLSNIDDMKIYIVPECSKDLLILKALNIVKNFGVNILFGKED